VIDHPAWQAAWMVRELKKKVKQLEDGAIELKEAAAVHGW
jgi:hypothetical protein